MTTHIDGDVRAGTNGFLFFDIGSWAGLPVVAAGHVIQVRPPMNLVQPDIVTYCVGQAASMAAVLLACGTKGKRYSLPNSRILIHQPSMNGLAGQATDIDIYAREILKMRDSLNKILADACGRAGVFLWRHAHTTPSP